MKNTYYRAVVALIATVVIFSAIFALIEPGNFGSNLAHNLIISTIWASFVSSAFLIARIYDKLEEGMHHHIDAVNMYNVKVNNYRKEDSKEDKLSSGIDPS